MELPKIDKVVSADEAENLAVEWQHWASDQDLSYGELIEYQGYFEALVDKYPELEEEFRENGII